MGGDTITDLGVPPGGYDSYANDINNQGQIVGYWTQLVDPPYTDKGWYTHPFIWQNGQMTDLTPAIAKLGPDATRIVQATGINDSGEIVGFFSDNNTGLNHGAMGFTYKDGQASVVQDDSKYDRSTDAVSNDGVIVGNAQSGLAELGAWSRDNTLKNLLPVTGTHGSGCAVGLGVFCNQANYIDKKSDAIVGWSYDGDPPDKPPQNLAAFWTVAGPDTYEEHSIISPTYPEDPSTATGAATINGTLWVVGYIMVPGTGNMSFMTKVDPEWGVETGDLWPYPATAESINSSGLVVGQAQITDGGPQHAHLWDTSGWQWP